MGFHASSPAASDRAFVTLLTNAPYIPGVQALVRSLKAVGTGADIVVMYTGGVARDDLDGLARYGARLVEVPLLDVSPEFAHAHSRKNVHEIAPFTKGTKPAFHTPLDNFSKLQLWQLTEYTDIVFLDADTIAVRPLDRLFDYPEFCAAPNVYESVADFHRLNSGVFTAKPSSATFDAMVAKLDVPGAFWRRTDQTFLEAYFPDWQGLPVFYNMLQYVWFNLPDLWSWDHVKLIHYQYEKPWEPEHERAALLRPLIDLWEEVYEHGTLPDLASQPAPTAE